MTGDRRYGWASYYTVLLRLMFLSHERQIALIRRKAEEARAASDPDTRLRLLLHCTDWPIDLVQGAPANAFAQEKRQEMCELQKEMLVLYEAELRRQERF